MQYIYFQSPANQVSRDEYEDNIGTIVLKLYFRKESLITFFGKQEHAFVEQESKLSSAEPEALRCDGGAASSISSSFLNRTDITERAVPIRTAQGGTVMTRTHVYLKT